MSKNTKFSENRRINLLIENILDELCPFLEEQAQEISEFTTIGKALGAGRDISVLLEMILSIARRFSRADGGTLYLVDFENKELNFHVIHNESLEIKQEGANIDLPGVQLYNDDGTPNLTNVSSYVFHTGEIINIEDVYKTKKFQFDGTRNFDDALNYRSQSMIVIPMRNHEDDIIGILQLINSKDFTSAYKTVPFSKDIVEKSAALANQASVILTQQMLIVEMKELFEAFIKAIAVSIDEKSRHTGGHIQRVTELSLLIAKKLNQDDTVFKNTQLSEDQIDELRIASLMHDTGKITTPNHIISKSTRLEAIHDRIELIKTRWELFKTNLKLKSAQQKLALFDQETKTSEINQIDMLCNVEIEKLEKDFQTISAINTNKGITEQDSIDELEKINDKSFEINGKSIPYLTKDEFKNLSILRGTLNSEEREIINSHASLTEKILNKLPWPKKLEQIPKIAGAHHEKLDGTGYPLHLDKNSLNIQARILAIADIFEALSAQDRPYKKPMSLSQTIGVLKQMSKNGALDKRIVQLFFESNAHLEYAKKHLAPSQIDV